MTQKRKESATQRILQGDLTLSHKANSQNSNKSKHQEIPETPVNDITKRLSETQTKRIIKPIENDRDPVKNPTKDPAVDLVGGHGGNLTRGAQL